MTKKLLFVGTILLVVGLVALAADVSGKWTFEQQGRQGNTTTVTLTLKADGGNLTGNMSQPGRDGNAMETEISNGKIDGSTVTFDVVRSMGQREFKQSFKGTVNGDSMDLEITRPGRGGGEPTTTKVTAKRATT